MGTKEGNNFWQTLKEREIKGRELVKQGHFPECYMVMFPDDDEVYCTCLTNGCPD